MDDEPRFASGKIIYIYCRALLPYIYYLNRYDAHHTEHINHADWCDCEPLLRWARYVCLVHATRASLVTVHISMRLMSNHIYPVIHHFHSCDASQYVNESWQASRTVISLSRTWHSPHHSCESQSRPDSWCECTNCQTTMTCPTRVHCPTLSIRYR